MTSQSTPNSYSQRWFASFHIPIDQTRTTAEVDFVCALAPLPKFRNMLDVCCGMGRHARALAGCGYSVTGVDRDSHVITQARELGGGPSYIQAEIRDFQPEQGAYDVVIMMGQSFGHFDAATNRAALGRLASGLRTHGRIILDVWSPDFFVSHQGERDFDLSGGVVHETKFVRDGRLFVQLIYSDGEREDFEWQLLSKSEMETVAASLSLALIDCCTNFDRSAKPSASQPRIQFVLERPA